MSEDEESRITPRIQRLRLQRDNHALWRLPLTQRLQSRLCIQSRKVKTEGKLWRGLFGEFCDDVYDKNKGAFTETPLQNSLFFFAFFPPCKCLNLELEPKRSQQALIWTSSVYSNSSSCYWNSSGKSAFDPSSYLLCALGCWWNAVPGVETCVIGLKGRKKKSFYFSGHDGEGWLWKGKQSHDAGEV